MALTHVDPSRQHGLARRAYMGVLRTPPGRWIAINIASRVDPWLLSHSNGRVGFGLMIPSALLETTGAKSGQPREATVLYFHEGDEVVLIASSFGREKHPSWYHNLKAHPACRLGGEPFVAKEVADPDECERLFAQAVRIFPGYADYQKRTAPIGRRIPVMRLTPATARP
ncbi:nitroreductase family deazaflavin-dependent oxidoreductase [Conexibacter sp. SYSU D00693]|uniref:nitroreductase family deazaflavin-dependent oxidoreductase n=1 Tax=Conexibacter sp. SYSU D00693 TaxID=2812560 RepID=UPI00196AE73D|nr:nitroreductase family deazaflavin-dependent oxidoreductase [Conexibacter sp. SYSU D00693]